MVDDSVTLKLSKELRNIAARLDKIIEKTAGERIAFTLFIWTDERCSYISTADRDVVRENMREVLSGWDSGMPDVPAHKVN